MTLVNIRKKSIIFFRFLPELNILSENFELSSRKKPEDKCVIKNELYTVQYIYSVPAPDIWFGL